MPWRENPAGRWRARHRSRFLVRRRSERGASLVTEPSECRPEQPLNRHRQQFVALIYPPPRHDILQKRGWRPRSTVRRGSCVCRGEKIPQVGGGLVTVLGFSYEGDQSEERGS